MVTLLLHLLRLLPMLCGGHRQVALENLALRHQLAVYKKMVNRPKLLSSDRLFWVALSRVWAGWRQALVIVSPNTVLRWQRRRFREYWARLSARPAAGRPRVSRQIRALVVRMAQANPLWGAPRIHGELQMLGIDVAERTVSRLVPKRRSPPSQTWRTFLTNHVRDLVSIDFFTVPTARLRVLFVFVVLAHDRRRVLHFNVTEHPTAAWTAQQIVDAFPDDSAPSYLLRDRDSVYGHVFRQRVKGMGVGEVLTTPHSPWQNPFAERLIGSIRRECLNHVLVLGERHLRRTLARSSRTTTGRVLTSRSKRIRHTAAQLSGLNSARSSRFAKSVASTIATSDGRPDPAQSVRHDRARPPVRLLAAPPPKGPASLWRPDGPALLASPPVYSLLNVPDLVAREHRPSSTRGMRFWRRTVERIWFVTAVGDGYADCFNSPVSCSKQAPPWAVGARRTPLRAEMWSPDCLDNRWRR